MRNLAVDEFLARRWNDRFFFNDRLYDVDEVCADARRRVRETNERNNCARAGPRWFSRSFARYFAPTSVTGSMSPSSSMAR